jgi:hypothetical protein
VISDTPELDSLHESRLRLMADRTRYQVRAAEVADDPVRLPGVLHGFEAHERMIRRIDERLACAARGVAWRPARRRGGVEYR